MLISKGVHRNELAHHTRRSQYSVSKYTKEHEEHYPSLEWAWKAAEYLDLDTEEGARLLLSGAKLREKVL